MDTTRESTDYPSGNPDDGTPTAPLTLGAMIAGGESWARVMALDGVKLSGLVRSLADYVAHNVIYLVRVPTGVFGKAAYQEVLIPGDNVAAIEALSPAAAMSDLASEFDPASSRSKPGESDKDWYDRRYRDGESLAARWAEIDPLRTTVPE